MASGAAAQTVTVIGSDTVGSSPISHSKDLAITPDRTRAVLHITSSTLTPDLPLHTMNIDPEGEHMPIIDLETGDVTAILPFGGYTDYQHQRLCINSVEVTDTRAVAIGRENFGLPSVGFGRIRVHDITPGNEHQISVIDLKDDHHRFLSHQVVIAGNEDYAAVLAPEVTMSGGLPLSSTYLFLVELLNGDLLGYPMTSAQGINGVVSLLDASTNLIVCASGEEIAILDTAGDLTGFLAHVTVPGTSSFVDVAITPDEKWALALANDGALTCINLTTLSVTTLSTSVVPGGVEALEVTNKYAVVMGGNGASTSVFVYDLMGTTPAPVGNTVSLTGTPHDLALSPNGNRAFVNTLGNSGVVAGIKLSDATAVSFPFPGAANWTVGSASIPRVMSESLALSNYRVVAIKNPPAGAPFGSTPTAKVIDTSGSTWIDLTDGLSGNPPIPLGAGDAFDLAMTSNGHSAGIKVDGSPGKFVVLDVYGLTTTTIDSTGPGAGEDALAVDAVAMTDCRAVDIGNPSVVTSKYNIVDLDPPIRQYCTSVPNSSGSPAVLTANQTGPVSHAANDLTLIANGLPTNTTGLFFYGTKEIQVLYDNGGYLCIGTPFVRLATVQGSMGTATYSLDLTAIGQGAQPILPDSTWRFQFWFRDTAAGGDEANTTDALSIPFCY